MYNCCFSLVDRPRVFGEIMYLLLCGCGVGFSVQPRHVNKLPEIQEIDESLVCHYSVVDTIEGWADAVTALMNSFLTGYYLEFNYDQLRPAGSSLHSGGKAPGHIGLKKSLEQMRPILLRAQGRKLTPIECHDIICHLSLAVLAGGIRRSSLISLFNIEDEEMLNSKTDGCFDWKTLNSQRALANNSAVLSPEENKKKDFDQILSMNKSNFGDPGFVFLEDTDCGINPCGEIGINPVWETKSFSTATERTTIKRETGFGFCNLVEINAAACKDEQEFFEAARAASFIATLQASYTSFPYLGEVTECIVKRDALIGVSITGMMDSPWIFDTYILQQGANMVVNVNQETAREIGIHPAARCTCIKPSGTASLELGCVGSGIHPHHAKKYFRRTTANPLEPVAKFFAKHNPHMIEEKPNGDLCITFPVQTDGITISEITTWDFLDKIFLVYENWVLPGHIEREEIGHNVSCTVMVKPDEWLAVANYIWNNRDKVQSMTFMPMEAPSKIPFIPRQTVETEHDHLKFKVLVKNYVPVDYAEMEEHDDVTIKGAACSSDICETGGEEMISGTGCRVFVGIRPNCEPEFEADGLKWVVVEEHENYYVARRKDS